MTELEIAARRYQRQRAAADRSYAALVPLILEARSSGMSLRAVAAVTGLSWGRIHQIEKEPQRG